MGEADRHVYRREAAVVKYAKLAKKDQTVAAKSVLTIAKKGQGKVTYTLASAKKGKKSFKKFFKVDKKTGKITVKNGLETGTYKVTVKVKASGTTNYEPVTKAVTFKVRVK